MKKIPNFFTLLNLLFGCCAIVFALQTESITIIQADDSSTSFSVPERLYYAAICIAIAAFIDFLDGFLARLLHACGEMGKQLDSLSDIVSFGVAPAVILFQFLRLSYMQQENGIEINIAWLLPAFLFACAGAYRLARFNIDTTQTYGFKGVPIPAAGLVVASLPLIAFYNYYDGAVNTLIFNKWFLYAVIFALSYLMISKLPIMGLKFKDYSLQHNLPKLILLVIAVIAAFLFKWMAVPVVFIAYIILSLAIKNKTT
ncbi:MAG TPA: CDP-alcohol phosphatidyltransferase family protein [Chitinophagaceae bacterium]|nr:CDP-alcohol phosphatidyltransferase family protein [Chitinophagaceae bacterium]